MIDVLICIGILWLIIGTYTMVYYIGKEGNPYKMGYSFTHVTIGLFLLLVYWYELWFEEWFDND